MYRRDNHTCWTLHLSRCWLCVLPVRMCNPFTCSRNKWSNTLPVSHSNNTMWSTRDSAFLYTRFFWFLMGVCDWDRRWDTIQLHFVYLLSFLYHRMSCILYLLNGSSFKWNIWIFLSVSTKFRAKTIRLKIDLCMLKWGTHLWGIELVNFPTISAR